ncbi:H/ACA snoRNP pseudouridylase subunit, partial [Nowakowskiella sp. JEL0078]
MSGFGRGGRGGGRGAPRGAGGFRGGRGGGRGGYGGNFAPMGPPESVIPIGSFVHSCEKQMVCKSTNEKIPHFNAPIFLENKTQIGKIDEIFGPINEVYFSVNMQDNIKAESFKTKDLIYISPDKLLPLDRFLPKPKALTKDKPLGRQGMVEKKTRGGFGGGRGGFGRGGAGGGRGGAGGGRGAPRGRGGFG